MLKFFFVITKNIEEQSVQYIKGVGPQLAKVLNKVGIFSLKDLFYYFPRAYEDRRFVKKIKDLTFGQKEMVSGTVEKNFLIRTRRYRTIVKTVLQDDSGQITLLWFNQPYLATVLKKGQKLLVIGKAQYNRASREIQLIPQEYEIFAEQKFNLGIGRVVPKYFLTEGISPKKMRQILFTAFEKFSQNIFDFLPANLRNFYQLPVLIWALRQIHFPENLANYKKARQRLVFEEFFTLQLVLMIQKMLRQKEKGFSLAVPPELAQEFKSSLPFALTADQEKVLGEIFDDLKSAFPMKRLLQGDVGSGKTVVAVAAILAAVRNQCQAAIMAPTEILANQHFQTISKFLKPFKIKPVLLTAGLVAKEKEKNLKKIKNGQAAVVIGTHALIQEKVEFKALRLVIIDEQHRFGVGQRLALIAKGNNPDLLIMTATPIPRTLALTFYGDLDSSVILQLPPGRILVKTFFAPETDRKKVYDFVKKKILEGERAFVVFPLVAESEKVDLAAATQAYESLKKGIFKDLEIGLIHGRLAPAEKEKVMKKFHQGKIKVLVATTVIEVGIDVPEATIMVIEHAERFGLAVLHQLRGRVGRGSKQAFCILIGRPETEESRARLKAIVSLTDGFKIAEVDLKLRGPGEVMGLRQSGFPEFKIADPVNDLKILNAARAAAEKMVRFDFNLEKPENNLLKEKIISSFGNIWEAPGVTN